MILRSVVDYWAMMDPRNPVFDMAPWDAHGSVDHSGKGHGYLPLSPDIVEGITLGGNISGLGESKANHFMDPEILVPFPVSTMSPMPSDYGRSPKWDWDSELNAL